MSAGTKEDMKQRAIRNYGFDLYGAMDKIKEHRKIFKGLSKEETRLLAIKELQEAGLVDENGKSINLCG
jgi:hypothetical protein